MHARLHMEFPGLPPLFNLVLDAVEDGIAIYSPPVRTGDVSLPACPHVAFATPSFLKLVGTSDAQDALKVVFRTGEAQELIRGLELEAARTGAPARAEMFLNDPPGAARYVQVMVQHLPARGEVQGCFALHLRDITEKRADEELRVRFERRLLEAQRQESLGLLAGGIANDFNNILTIILGNASLAILELSPGSPALEAIKHIKGATQRASELTKQMLAYSGKAQFAFRRVDISLLVRQMRDFLEVAASKSATLVYGLEETSLVEADVSQIRQVLVNLAVNASEAIGSNPGTIRVRSFEAEFPSREAAEPALIPADPGGHFSVLEVADDGCGMDSKTASRMFDPFYTTKVEGRGLGLASVYGIVKAHKGGITVTSEKAKGTSVRVYLPVLPVESPLVMVTAKPLDRSSRAILVVDDEESVRETLSRILKRFGYQVLLAADGVEGLDVFRRLGSRISLAIVDLVMPRMGGEEFTRKVLQSRPDLSVILMSGYDRNEVFRLFLTEPSVSFLAKPFGAEELLHVVSVALKREPRPSVTS